ncbi:aspartate/glutamate racemase family protein [Kaistia defluvii]|uniref:aspartate/glutamate racemase family protein n=1 Tax=Kaistia defluvii TaxID=410841 RepID=UPI00225345BF|nr:aspartate/glutamate racemase family protein [Kaistia defluvii]MCX5517358.1 aspartate/glutamate racemase family protein [Kaistia defluvii]
MTTVSGTSLGLLILDTAFARAPGDAGNIDSWGYPVQYRIVRGADALRVIDGRAEGLLDAFIAAALDLVAHGAGAISTTCGFLALYQKALAAALPVPVATSSLLQIPIVERLLPRGRTVGVLTMDAAKLTPDHFAAVGVDHPVPTEGLPRDVGAIVLECTNMPPYAAEISRALGLPVYDIVTLGDWLMAGVKPRVYPQAPHQPGSAA